MSTSPSHFSSSQVEALHALGLLRPSNVSYCLPRTRSKARGLLHVCITCKCNHSADLQGFLEGCTTKYFRFTELLESFGKALLYLALFRRVYRMKNHRCRNNNLLQYSPIITLFLREPCPCHRTNDP